MRLRCGRRESLPAPPILDRLRNRKKDTTFRIQTFFSSCYHVGCQTHKRAFLLSVPGSLSQSATLLCVSIKVKIQSHRGGARVRSPRFSVRSSLCPKPGGFVLDPIAIVTRSCPCEYLRHEGQSDLGGDDHRFIPSGSTIRGLGLYLPASNGSATLCRVSPSPPLPISLWVKANTKPLPPQTQR